MRTCLSVVPRSGGMRSSGWQAWMYVWFSRRLSGEMATGVVKWFSPKKGYGFITMDDGQEVFVHYSAIDGNGFRSLDQGEEVKFEVAQGPKGLQASKVMRA